MGLGVVKQMKKGNMTDNWLDLNTRLIAHSKKPVLDAIAVEPMNGDELLNSILLYAVDLGDMYTANAVHKAICLNALFRTNKFVAANNVGQAQEYLDSLDEEERSSLLTDFFMKFSMNFGTPDDVEALRVLTEYLKQSSLVLR